MKTNMVLRNIRFKSTDALKVLRKGLISKSQIVGKEYVEINSASLPLAIRYCEMCPIDVLVDIEWKNVGTAKYNDLEQLFKIEENKIEKEIVSETVIDNITEIEDIKEDDNTVDDDSVDTFTEDSVDTEYDEEEESEPVSSDNNVNNYSFTKKKKRRH